MALIFFCGHSCVSDSRISLSGYPLGAQLGYEFMPDVYPGACGEGSAVLPGLSADGSTPVPVSVGSDEVPTTPAACCACLAMDREWPGASVAAAPSFRPLFHFFPISRPEMLWWVFARVRVRACACRWRAGVWVAERRRADEPALLPPSVRSAQGRALAAPRLEARRPT